MKIVVIGGGISGLYTIYKLMDHPKFRFSDFILYESSSDLGGRIKTEYNRNNIPIELGAGRFSIESHKLLYDLVKELGISCIDFNYEKLVNTNINTIKEYDLTDSELVIKLLSECKKIQLLNSPNLDLSTISFKSWILTYSGIGVFNLLEELCGYSVINNELLPAEEGLNILNQHPEACGKFFNNKMKSRWKQPKDGFIKIINSIVDKIKNKANIKIFTGYNVKTIEKKEKCYELYVEYKDDGVKNLYIESDMVFLTSAADSISKLELSGSLEDIKQIYDGVVQVPLFKMFLHFSENWWSKYVETKQDFFIVNKGPERKFYFSSRKNEIMIYSDSNDAILMNQIFSGNNDNPYCQLYKKIANFFNLNKLPYYPIDVKYHFWSSGVSFWKINTKKDNLFAIKKRHGDKKFFIVSDMITNSSGWINSTLGSIDDIINSM